MATELKWTLSRGITDAIIVSKELIYRGGG